MKKSALMVLSLAALALLGSCGGGTSATSSSTPAGTSVVSGVTAVKITGESSVEMGSTLKLSATVEGTGDVSQLVSWKSSDAKVLTINDTGLVTPVAPGKATVTATSEADNTKSASLEITVTEKKVTYTAISSLTQSMEATVAGQVVAVNTKSFIVHDGTAGVMVYLNNVPSQKVGHKVVVAGTTGGESKYANGLPQFDSNAVIHEYDGEVNVPAATALTDAKLKEWKASYEANGTTEDDYKKQFLQTTEVKAYSWQTVVGESGGYKTFDLDGSDIMIEAAYLDEEAFPVSVGSTYNVEGYFAGYNYHGYAAFVFTKIEKVESQVAPTSLTVESEIKGKHYVGTTAQLKATANAGANDSVTWASLDADKATVDENGLVTLKAAGEVTITATSKLAETVIGRKVLTIEALPANDGSTAAKAFTADGLIEYVDSSAYNSKADVYVTGVVKSASFSSDKKNWTIDLVAEKGTVELFRAKTDNLTDYEAAPASLKGATIVAHGKSLYYASGKKYELNTGCVVDSVTPGEEPETSSSEAGSTSSEGSVYDLTAGTSTNGSYKNEWTYGDLTLAGASNNSGKWEYMKFGPNADTLALETYLGTYVKTGKLTHAVSKVTLSLGGNATYNKDEEKAAIKVECYSDNTFSTLVSSSEEVEVPAVASGATGSVSVDGTWAAGNYYKLVFNITNTTTYNGVVAATAITFAV
ncbi:MAG: Ig-like domain-containing protein [Bacilli bacterium]|nr:Ig-like domain-containing protein [Bacilli bacterium]